jgi:hypothetical protein
MAVTLLWTHFTDPLYLEVCNCYPYYLAVEIFATGSKLDMERNHSSCYSLGKCRNQMDFPMSRVVMETLDLYPTAMLEVPNCYPCYLAVEIFATDSELDMEKNH